MKEGNQRKIKRGFCFGSQGMKVFQGEGIGVLSGPDGEMMKMTTEIGITVQHGSL